MIIFGLIENVRSFAADVKRREHLVAEILYEHRTRVGRYALYIYKNILAKV